MSTNKQASSKTPEQNDLGKKVWSSFGFNVTPKAPQLESFSPTDERFSEATSKTDSVFRLSEEERSSLKTFMWTASPSSAFLNLRQSFLRA
jgi:hypothetical protein